MIHDLDKVHVIGASGVRVRTRARKAQDGCNTGTHFLLIRLESSFRPHGAPT